MACIGILAQRITLAEAIGAVALIGYGIAIVATLRLPETKGISLTADLGPAADASGHAVEAREYPVPGKS